jgi:SNF2 family DNA or RNA helicase
MPPAPLLIHHDWQVGYRHEDGDLIELFYNPALTCAVHYDRMTGYFSAGVLAAAARGIASLIANGGRMRLLVGCQPDPEESQAILDGYDLRARVEQKLLDTDITPADPESRTAIELLAWMVANQVMDVKVAVPIRPDGRPEKTGGIYHEKVGLIKDAGGNRICFCGSINETKAGWVVNRESFDVYCSWQEPREQSRLQIHADAFEMFWSGRAHSVAVYDFPQAVKEKLLAFLPTDSIKLITPRFIPEPEPPPFALTAAEKTRIVWAFLRHAAKLTSGLRVGEATSAVTPWPHQLRTMHRFLTTWPARVLIADEVGLGKTISAGLIIRQALLSGRARRILLLTPKSVQIQWQQELYEKFNLRVPIYDGARLLWRAVHGETAREENVTRTDWQSQPIVLCSSALMRRKERVTELLEAQPWDLVLLDEAHHARRRGAGSTQEKGPNALLGLMRRLAPLTPALLLLTATPMQVHPVEIWDLLNLLGLPPEWANDDRSIARYFEKLSANPSPEELEELVRLFQSTERYFGPIPDNEMIELLPAVSNIRRKKAVNSLRDPHDLNRKQLDSAGRANACKVLQAGSPLRFRMVRNTRALLRKYAIQGLLKLPIAERDPVDIAVSMTAAEEKLYKDVEDYISDTYQKASQSDRSAVGFVMTMYRRRLASSFVALKCTLNNRLRRMEGAAAVEVSEEDLTQDETRDEVMTVEDAQALAETALGREETEHIHSLLRDIAKINVDSKAKRLLVELRAVLAQGYDSAIVFTQFTDTMDYLRELAGNELPELSVASYSGTGGSYRDGSGHWITCSKEEIKRRLRAKQVRLLIASDAAAEGLNLQSCGVLVNYDLPWNPMKIEQRIGRIDRLGQRNERIRIINLAYKGTVEADVYFIAGARINLFQGIVGKLQPILSRLPKQIEEVLLTTADNRAALRQRFLADVETQINNAEITLDIDEAAAGSLEVPEMPAPAVSMEQLENTFRLGNHIPQQADWNPLDPRSYNVKLAGMQQGTRVTTDPDVFEYSGENHQLFSPCGPLYELLANLAAVDLEEGEGICWLEESDTGWRMWLNTKYGIEEVQTIDRLVSSLPNAAPPAPPPLSTGKMWRIL